MTKTESLVLEYVKTFHRETNPDYANACAKGALAAMVASLLDGHETPEHMRERITKVVKGEMQ